MKSSNPIASALLKRRSAEFGLLLLCCLPLWACGQCEAPKLPDDQSFEVVADYRESDAKASDALVWLSTHSLDECLEARQQLNAFVLVWLSGHPDIIIELQPEALPFLERYPELLFPMLHGMAAYQLGKPAQAVDPVAAHVAGLQVIADVASRVEGYKKDDDIRALRKLRRRGKLESYCRGLLR